MEAFTELQVGDGLYSNKIELINREERFKSKSSGYFPKRNILMRHMQTKDIQFYLVICIPLVLVNPLLEPSHRYLLSRHLGSNSYLPNMKSKCYWTRLKDDIKGFSSIMSTLLIQ